MTIGNYAMMKNGDNLVINTVVKDSEFVLEGYYFVEMVDGVFCQQGMYYNSVDQLFYDDPGFTIINGIPVTGAVEE